MSSDVVGGIVYIFVDNAMGASKVRFYLDGSLVQTENNPPWDFAGTTSNDLANPFDTRTLVDGQYQVSAIISTASGTESLEATMQVANQPPAGQGAPASQLHLSWQGSAASSLSISWFAGVTSYTPRVRYRLAGTSSWQTVSGVVGTVTADGRYLVAHLSELMAATNYEFQVALGSSVWSKTYATATQPASGPQDFDAVYVADTGLIGRTDGLTTGTEEVITEIAMLDPGLVLLGGDYVYFDTDKRFGTLERSIGVWFEQMAPIAETTPMMPAWGNHEVQLQENVDTWVDYFATPNGWNNRRMYSFDIGDAHLVAVYGIHESQAMPQDALDWLVADLNQAREAGQRWLIPYFHAAPFSEGTNHTSALKLRAQLGPVFEAAGVKVVLTSHDQSYERTFPLTGVPSNISVTSSNQHCYTLNDGVSWIKVSPGGKLSNISKGFSPWRSPQPPYWTAVRDNSRHHFAHLMVSAGGELTVDIYGVAGSAYDAGVPIWRSDRVRYTTQGCDPELTSTPSQLTFALDTQGSDSQSVQVAGGSGGAPFQVTQVPNWLSVSPLSGVTPATLTLAANASGQPLGFQRGVLEISAGNGKATWLPVDLIVGAAGYDLWFADNPQRLAPSPLEGKILQGNTYIFTQPDDGVARVSFYLDDPSGSGSPIKIENKAPYDLGGTASNDNALPFDTTELADGSYTLTARLDLESGGQFLVTSTVQVQNDLPQLLLSQTSISMRVNSPNSYDEESVVAQMSTGQTPSYSSQTDAGWLSVSPSSGLLPQTLTLAADTQGMTSGHYQGHATITAGTGQQGVVTVNLAVDVPETYRLEVSRFPDRHSPSTLDGASLEAGEVYIFVPDVAGIQRVDFFLDDPQLSGKAIKVEGNAPWDFAGTVTAPPRNAIPFDTTGLSGNHVISAKIRLSSGSVVIHAGFTVSP